MAFVKNAKQKSPMAQRKKCDPNGIRTRVTAVKGRCPGPLDDRVTKAGQYQNCCSLTQGKSTNCFQSFLFETGASGDDRRDALRRDKQRRGYRLRLSS